jgi:membrane protease YdiL (CAAX protease family)
VSIPPNGSDFSVSPIEEQPRVVPWRGWEALLVYLVALLITTPLTFVASVSLTKNGAIGAAALITEVVLFFTVLVWVRVRHQSKIEALGWNRTDIKGDVLAGLGAGVLGIVLQLVLVPLELFVTREIVGHSVTTPKQLPLAKPGALLLILIGVTVTVLAPIVEELFFRGVLFQAFRKWMSLGAAAAWSAVAFAIAHVSPLLFLPIGALGYVLARTFEQRKSILASMVGHAVFNTFGFVVIVLTLK